jgi:hypothetical protein
MFYIFKMIKLKYLCMLLVVVSAALPAKAASEQVKNYLEIARQRQYIGGPDESDLKVQTKLISSKKKKQKKSENSEQ